jgi:phosphoglycolate phosphatase
VLFDLDGTLLDTAPDMIAALHRLQAEHRRPVVPYDEARPWVSHGALGMLGVGFGELPEAERTRLHQRYLDLYADDLAGASRLFAGMEDVLLRLERRRVPWGVVTNKPARLTEPLLKALGLRGRCACVVSGDTVGRRKPFPDPLLHALGLIAADAATAVYVGDAARDIAAGRAAGMLTVAALYGYIPPGDDPDGWGADHQVRSPADLVPLLSGVTG